MSDSIYTMKSRNQNISDPIPVSEFRLKQIKKMIL
jgi:hypothetical protein